MAELCSRCRLPNVAGCEGRGYIRRADDDLVVDSCPNIYRRQLAQHLGPEIVGAPAIPSSPFLKLNPAGGEPLIDLTQENLYIVGCTWRGLLAHLRYTLGFKRTKHIHKIITDERIKNVFVGSESYKSRPQRVREDIDTFNNIADLVGATYHLVIIKLGYLGYKNQAAAGALKEALLHRESIGLPTWLVNDPERSWTHSYDPDVAQFVSDRYTEITIDPVAGYAPRDPDGPGTPEDSGLVVDEEDPPSTAEAFEVEEDPPPPPPSPRRTVRERPPPPPPPPEEGASLGGIDLPGDNRPERRNNWRKQR